MECLAAVEKFFNNQSVGAFLGAFVAFGLVVVNDYRRDLRKVRNIRAEVEVTLATAQGKLESVRRNRTLIREHNRVIPAPILKFDVVLIRQLSSEVRDRLSLDQRRALDGLCYTMEAIDELLGAAYEQAKLLASPHRDVDRVATAENLLDGLGDAIVNLKRLDEMCGNYIAGRYDIIVNKQYDRLDYEEA